MKEMLCDKTRRVHALITILGIFALASTMLISIAGASQFVYVTNYDDNTTSVIDTSTNKVITTIPVGAGPEGMAISPDGTKIYVDNYDGNTTSVIDTATNKVTASNSRFEQKHI